MKISLVIPAYNEAPGVEETAEKLNKILPRLRAQHEVEVIFVNDGSKDETAARLKAAFANDPGVSVISHEVNRGLGAAIRTGFKHTTGDIIITTDFDGTFRFSTMPQIIAHMLMHDVDVVTASPYHPNGGVEGVPPHRLLFSYGASLLYRLLVSWKVHSWTALYRAYRREVIENISFESDGFLAGTELLIKAIQAGYTVSEFPTTLHVRTFGQSSMQIFRVTKTHVTYQLRLLLSGAPRRRSIRRRTT